MIDCIHRNFRVNDCPCYYYETEARKIDDCLWQDECREVNCPCDKYIKGEKKQREGFKIIYQGVAIVYAECANCGQSVQYPTDRPYTLCPYCGKRAV